MHFKKGILGVPKVKKREPLGELVKKWVLPPTQICQ